MHDMTLAIRSAPNSKSNENFRQRVYWRHI